MYWRSKTALGAALVAKNKREFPALARIRDVEFMCMLLHQVRIGQLRCKC